MFKTLKNDKDTVISATENLLKQLHVKVSKASIKEQLESHPDFPSILSVSDCLKDWGVANTAYMIDQEEFSVDNLLFPLMAPLNNQEKQFIVIKKIENGTVYYESEGTNNGKMLLEDFLKNWSYIALYATSDEKSGEHDYKQKQFNQFLTNSLAPSALIVLIILIALTLTSLPINTPTLISTIILMLLKLSGLAISVLLLIQSINTNNPFIKNLCTLGGKNNCNAILNTNAAKVTSWLSWSEVGFFYFAGSFLSLLFNPSSLILLAWFNLLALPFTIYSISYQYRHKNWCILCCAVQAVLLLEAITFLSFPNLQLLPNAFGITINEILIIVCSFLTPIITWSFLKPFFMASLQVQPIKKQLNSFKYNTELFKKALTAQARYAITNDLKPIILGNENASNVITMVSNPFCGPCAKAHKALEQLIKYRTDLRLNIIITAAEKDKSRLKEMAIHVNALNRNNKEIIANALHEWFELEEKDHSKWMQKYPTIKNGDENELLNKQENWSNMAEVKYTPTIFINGYKLPEPYTWMDLKYLIN